MQALVAGLFLNSYGNYAVVFEDNFGWSKTRLSAAFSASRLQSSLTSPLQGWALDRFGITAVMRLGVVVLSIGFVGLSQMQNQVHFIAALAVITFGAAMAGFLSVTTGIVRWFERKRARALAIGSMGFAVGGILTPGIVWVLERIGWRWALALSGLLALVIGWPVAGWFSDTPSERGEQVDGLEPDDSAVRAEGVSKHHLTLSEAMRTRGFWMISLGHTSALFVVSGVIAHLSLFLTTERGFTLQQASLVGGLIPVFQFVGMLAGGTLGDRFNKRLLACLAMVGHMTGLLLLTYGTATIFVVLFTPLHGLAWGVRGPLMQAIRADYFGSTHFAKIMGISALVIAIGMAGGPLVAGYLADRTGSYQLGFTIIALIAGFGMLFFVLATPPTARQTPVVALSDELPG